MEKPPVKLRKLKSTVILSSIKNTKFFYFRNNKGVPLITVCSINYNDNWYKGLSFCSLNDIPNKKRGREIAFGRAVTAAVMGVPYYFEKLNKRVLKQVNLDATDIDSYFNNNIFFPPPKRKI